MTFRDFQGFNLPVIGFHVKKKNLALASVFLYKLGTERVKLYGLSVYMSLSYT